MTVFFTLLKCMISNFRFCFVFAFSRYICKLKFRSTSPLQPQSKRPSRESKQRKPQSQSRSRSLNSVARVYGSPPKNRKAMTQTFVQEKKSVSCRDKRKEALSKSVIRELHNNNHKLEVLLSSN